MVAALYSSRDEGTKDFINGDGIHFGWETVDVYRLNIMRAKYGHSRRVPKLKYSYIVRDSWTSHASQDHAGISIIADQYWNRNRLHYS